MLILTCLSQLQRLEEALRRSLPLALPVYGAVLNINRGNPGELEVVVDSWPNFGAILARRRGEGCRRGWPRCRRPSRGPREWSWRSPTTTPTCTPTPAPCLSPGERNHPPPPPSVGRTPIVPQLTAPPGRRLAPGVRVGTLSPAHVDLLNETWPYGGNVRSRRYLGELLGRYPHFCLQDGAGDPLSWTLTDHFGTGTHGYTLPGHRRHGHMRAVLSLAARQAQARGFPAFG
ncbi:GLYL3 protein, partial [Rissa tridactyla]|nr:GLYL3 protein [Rissa tridactyla]